MLNPFQAAFALMRGNSHLGWKSAQVRALGSSTSHEVQILEGGAERRYGAASAYQQTGSGTLTADAAEIRAALGRDLQPEDSIIVGGETLHVISARIEDDGGVTVNYSRENPHRPETFSA